MQEETTTTEETTAPGPLRPADLMTVYELSNPSDTMTFEAPDLEIAACVAFILGNGNMGAFPREGGKDREVPLFLFGGALEWYEKTFKATFALDDPRLMLRVANALDSVWYVGFGERGVLAKILQRLEPGARQSSLDEWSDARRTSVSNYVAFAGEYAAALRKAAYEKDDEPTTHELGGVA